jgi:hypothetical protein
VTDKLCEKEKEGQYVLMTGKIDQIATCLLSFEVNSGCTDHMVWQVNLLDTHKEHNGRVGVANGDSIDVVPAGKITVHCKKTRSKAFLS